MFLTQLVYYPISIGQDRLFTLDINLKKLFSSWIIIFFIISIDLFIQFLTLKNILGFEAVK